MTRIKWKLMTPTQRQIKVAELCGWKVVPIPVEIRAGLFWLVAPNGLHSQAAYPSISECWDIMWKVGEVPDYLNDLNAMYEVEDSVIFKAGKSLIDAYEENLLITVSDLTREQWVDEIHHWHATAAQRAEAFVLTMDKE